MQCIILIKAPRDVLSEARTPAGSVLSEARTPAGRPGGGEWTKTPLSPLAAGLGGHLPSTPEQRNAAKARGVVVPPTSWGLTVARDPDAKVQATWHDSKGRKQYGYHPRAIAERDAHKFGAVETFGKQLPDIRRKVKSDLRLPDASPERVAAAIIAIIDQTTMRVGSEQYAQENGTFGASSLRKDHVAVNGNEVGFRFSGKHAQAWDTDVKDSAVAKCVKHLLELPGERLMQYRKADGSLAPFTEKKVNDYLAPFGVTAKQFRTFHASRLCKEYLDVMGPPKDARAAQKNIVQAVVMVSTRLGNTPSVCRSSYILPAIMDDYAKSAPKQGELFKSLQRGLSSQERTFVGYLRRLGLRIKKGLVVDKDPFP